MLVQGHAQSHTINVDSLHAVGRNARVIGSEFVVSIGWSLMIYYNSPTHPGFTYMFFGFCLDPSEKEQVGNVTDPEKEHLVTSSNTWLVSKH